MNATDPFDKTGNGPVIVGMAVYVIVTLAGISTVLYAIYRLLARLL
jgi:hypothetical protein